MRCEPSHPVRRARALVISEEGTALWQGRRQRLVFKEEHEMLVSGRPSKIRFPGAKGDSELSPVQDVVDIPDREAYDRAGGGDRVS